MNPLLVLPVLAVFGGIAAGLQGPLSSLMGKHVGVMGSVFLIHVGGAVFSGFSGALDGQGQGSAQLNAPPLPPNWVGQQAAFAYAAKNPWDFASNAATIEVVP